MTGTARLRVSLGLPKGAVPVQFDACLELADLIPAPLSELLWTIGRDGTFGLIQERLTDQLQLQAIHAGVLFAEQVITPLLDQAEQEEKREAALSGATEAA